MNLQPASSGRRHPRATGGRSRAFTLIEVLIVVVILGVLASIVVVSVSGMTEDARQTSFATAVKRLADGASRYELEVGPLPDSSSGTLPVGFDAYVYQVQFENGTPIGGVWDSERYDIDGVECAAVGVHFNGAGETRDDAYMLLIDQQCDDGDLATGAFRRFAAGRYYWWVGG